MFFKNDVFYRFLTKLNPDLRFTAQNHLFLHETWLKTWRIMKNVIKSIDVTFTRIPLLTVRSSPVRHLAVTSGQTTNLVIPHKEDTNSHYYAQATLAL